MGHVADITSAQEDYLEAILRLAREKGAARVRDIADALSVHKSTVTAALKNLAARKLVNYSPYEMTTLTPKGQALAEEIEEHHASIRQFLTDVLLIDDATAEENACRMEHAMDDVVLARLGDFAKFSAGSGKKGRPGFRAYIEKGGGS